MNREMNGHFQSKLTPEDVLLIRECEMDRERLREELVELDRRYREERARIRQGIRELSRQSLARKFEVSKETIRDCWFKVLGRCTTIQNQ